MEAFFGSVTSPLYVMANAALAGVINMIPGAQAALTDTYHTVHRQMVDAGLPQYQIDGVRNNAIAWGWW